MPASCQTKNAPRQSEMRPHSDGGSRSRPPDGRLADRGSGDRTTWLPWAYTLSAAIGPRAVLALRRRLGQKRDPSGPAPRVTPGRGAGPAKPDASVGVSPAGRPGTRPGCRRRSSGLRLGKGSAGIDLFRTTEEFVICLITPPRGTTRPGPSWPPARARRVSPSTTAFVLRRSDGRSQRFESYGMRQPLWRTGAPVSRRAWRAHHMIRHPPYVPVTSLPSQAPKVIPAARLVSAHQDRARGPVGTVPSSAGGHGLSHNLLLGPLPWPGR